LKIKQTSNSQGLRSASDPNPTLALAATPHHHAAIERFHTAKTLNGLSVV
jgi:hypothetical protein